MNVAVCVSGAVRSGRNPPGDLRRYNKILKAKFDGADFYYATWDRFQEVFVSLFPDETQMTFFPEPDISYHPYLDIKQEDWVSPFFGETVEWVKSGGTERIEWTSHHTKQILAHALLVRSLPKSYDVIVRARYDSVIYSCAEFLPFLEDAVKRQRANGFAVTKQSLFDQLYDSDMTSGSKMTMWMLDQMILHPPEVLDVELVFELDRKKLLHPAEYGWFQVLGMQPGHSHVNHHGWVNHDKNVLGKFLR